MIQQFGHWFMLNKENFEFFIHCRNELVPQVREGFGVLWSVSRMLDSDGVYRGSAHLRGYYVQRKKGFGLPPSAA